MQRRNHRAPLRPSQLVPTRRWVITKEPQHERHLDPVWEGQWGARALASKVVCAPGGASDRANRGTWLADTYVSLVWQLWL